MTQNEVYEMSQDYVLDLIAYFNIAKEQVIKLLDKAIKNSWTTEKFFLELQNLFEEE